MKEGKRLGKVFIDTNIINYAIGFRDADIFAWIKEIYETIYIHQSVLDELVINKHIAQKYIDQKDWLLFNPTDNLTPEELVVYSFYVDRVTTGFANLDKKKKKERRPIKNTTNIGEIDSLAGALYLSANLICSNDFDIKEVIDDERLTVNITTDDDFQEVDEEDIDLDEELTEADLAQADTGLQQLIVQDTLEDLCCYSVAMGLATKKLVRTFFKVSHPNDKKKKLAQKLNRLNQRLAELP
ncbi:hypothetical protein [Priestia flexa]|uniref:hypothetical protein n=1 Tax=Priestia flexa TaxID=86664 RepID=UPI00099BAEEF|nr:hypothetical protein [Priestia flexa]AQX55891.1 hypothetical protein BC359_17310 [Priestia flexa]